MVYTDTVHTDEGLLATAITSWHLEADGDETHIVLVDQVTSFTGQDGIDSHHLGHEKALAQLADRFKDA